MGCGCRNKEMMSDYERVSSLASKAARMEGVVMVVFKKPDGTYGFCAEGRDEIKGEIVEYRYFE